MRTTDFFVWFVVVLESMPLLEPFDESLGSATNLLLCFIEGGGRRASDGLCVKGLVYSRCPYDNKCVSEIEVCAKVRLVICVFSDLLVLISYCRSFYGGIL
jgi:hypothetical protein